MTVPPCKWVGGCVEPVKCAGHDVCRGLDPINRKHKTGYMPVGGGYEYAALRNGLSVRHPDGREVYVQPGDDETEMRLVLSALDELALDANDPKRAAIADIMLGVYFV